MSKQTTNLLLIIGGALLIVAAVLGILNLATALFSAQGWMATVVYVLFAAAAVIFAVVLVFWYLNKRNRSSR